MPNAIDLATARTQYANYRRKMARNPDTALETINFNEWCKKQGYTIVEKKKNAND